MSGATPTARPNFSIKEDIRAYWSKRSETFDQSWGHKIRTDGELECWADLFRRHGAIASGLRVLQLASGTGEATRVLLRLGAAIDALDLCEPMIVRARGKHAGAAVRFHLGDAESTMMPSDHYDAVVCRHLVWTLVDPEAALADWLRVLRPGGRIVVVDGDWVRSTRKARFFRMLAGWLDGFAGVKPLWDQAAHERIMAQVRFRDGLTAAVLGPMVEAAGYHDVRVEGLDPVRRHQWRSASWAERLRLLATYDGNTFVLSAAKPMA